MRAHIHCLHTAERDVAIYEALFAKTGAALRLTHDVRPELLGADQGAVHSALVSDADVVLCSCTTLVPLVEDGPAQVNVLAHAMQQACAYGVDILLVAYTDRALGIAQEALGKVSSTQGRSILVDTESGRLLDAVQGELRDNGVPDCVVLAQASMSQFAAELTPLNCPVLTTPETAVSAAIARAGDVRGMALG